MRCCAPGRGCNLPTRARGGYRGGEECLRKAAERCQDAELARSVSYWWGRYRRLPLWRVRSRREALDAYRRAVALAFEAGLEPRTATLPMSWGAGFSPERAIADKTAELVSVERALPTASAEARDALEARRRELLEQLERYRNPEPSRLRMPDPSPPPASWGAY